MFTCSKVITAFKHDKKSVGYFQKNWVGTGVHAPGGDVRHASWNPYPISDQNLWFPYPIPDLIKNLIPYFRPEALEPSAWPKCETSYCDTCTVVGINIKREMVLSPNDEEVANSSQKHLQFKTRVHKPYPISGQNGRNWYPISDQNGWKPYPLAPHIPPPPPRGRKIRCRLLSLNAYASEPKKTFSE